MGVEPFLVASTVEAVMAQRLVRSLCPKCKEPFEPKPDDVPKDFPWEDYKKAENRFIVRWVAAAAASSVMKAGKAFMSCA